MFVFVYLCTCLCLIMYNINKNNRKCTNKSIVDQSSENLRTDFEVSNRKTNIIISIYYLFRWCRLQLIKANIYDFSLSNSTIMQVWCRRKLCVTILRVQLKHEWKISAYDSLLKIKCY